MSNVEILEELFILGDVRQHLGANDEHDTSKDTRIEEMTADAMVEAWSGWHLGSGGWAREIISNYKHILKLKDER